MLLERALLVESVHRDRFLCLLERTLLFEGKNRDRFPCLLENAVLFESAGRSLVRMGCKGREMVMTSGFVFHRYFGQ